MKQKIYKIFFIILIIALIIVIGLIAVKYTKSYINESESKEVVSMFLESVQEENKESNTEQDENEIIMNGYKVIGIIKIPKIEIEYPILDITTYNPADTSEPMKYGIVKYWGDNVNEYGNLSLAGHNYYNGTMFGKTKKLEVGDMVELTDLKNDTIKYQIYDKFSTDPNDVTILENNDKTVREVTLITCTNGNRNRLILKAREIID